MRRLNWIGLMIILGGIAAAGDAWGQGYGLYEQGACAMGRGGAGVASPCPDGSSVFYNPAAIAFVKTQELGLGGVLIGPRGNFTDSTTGQLSTLNNRWYPGPNIYYARPAGRRAALGFGVFAPYGLTTDWPTTSEGRFLGYKSLVQGLYLQPTLAVRLSDRLAVGAGIDITHMSVELRQRVDLSTQPLPITIPGAPTFHNIGVPLGTDFADLDLKGGAWHTGFHVGVQLKATDKLSFGARYLSGQRVDITGTIATTQIPTGIALPAALGPFPAGTQLDTLLAAKFQPGQLLSPQSVNTQLPLPDQVVAGMAVQATSRLKLLADYQFTRWSMFDQLAINGQYLQNIIFESYKDTHGVRIGAEFALTGKTVLRAGFDTHTVAAPDQTVTPNLPEGPRQEYFIGFGANISAHMRFDCAYMYLHQQDRAGRTTNGGLAVPTAAVNNGTYTFMANVLSASLSLHF